MTENEARQNLEALDAKQEEINKLRRECYNCIKECQQSRLQSLVGKCFRKHWRYYKIISVPEDKELITLSNTYHSDFNPYQLPALVIDTEPGVDGMAIFQDTMFTKAIASADMLAQITSEYSEISKAEFNAQLRKMMNYYESLGANSDPGQDTIEAD